MITRPISQSLERGLGQIEALVEKVMGQSCHGSECDRLGRVLCHRCAELNKETWVCAEHSERCEHCGQINCLDCAAFHLTFCAKAPDLNEEWRMQ